MVNFNKESKLSLIVWFIIFGGFAFCNYHGFGFGTTIFTAFIWVMYLLSFSILSVFTYGIITENASLLGSLYNAVEKETSKFLPSVRKYIVMVSTSLIGIFLLAYYEYTALLVLDILIISQWVFLHIITKEMAKEILKSEANDA